MNVLSFVTRAVAMWWCEGRVNGQCGGPGGAAQEQVASVDPELGRLWL